MLKHEFDLNYLTQREKIIRGLFIVSFLLMAVGSLALPSRTVSAADGTFSLGGNAEIATSAPIPTHPKAIQLTSTCAGRCLSGPPAGELTTASVIYLPDHTLKFKDLHTLSVDFKRLTGDCGGGSPRFQIGLDTNFDGQLDGSIFIYLGPIFNYINCSPTWETSGNLLFNGTEPRFDTAQFLGGTFYDSWRGALNLAGEASVCYILLVVDGAWYPAGVYGTGNFQNSQVFHFDNVRVNNDLFSVTSGNSTNLTTPEIPTLARQNLEQYLTGISEPRDLFGINSYYGRRYSWTNILRSGFLSTQRRGLQNRNSPLSR